MNARPTQTDVAREAGVSRALVSMALTGTGRVAPETRDRIRDAAARLGYARNLSAANLATNTSPVIGVILPDLRNPFFEDLVAAVGHHADGAGLLPLLATASNEVDRERLTMRRFRELQVRGVITVSPAVPREELQEYGEFLPLVVVGESGLGGLVDSVHLDEDAAATELIGHLASRGWSHIAYLYDDIFQRDRGLAGRRQALMAAAGRAGVELTVHRADGGVADVVGALCEDAGDRRTAVIGHNDLLATEIASAIRSHGLAVGVDVGVAGYDDTSLARRSQADLTSIGQSIDEQGRAAVGWIADRALSPDRPARHLATPPHLVIRSST
ncbi:LacI family DNA-binding transcriptional regulator [Acidipropionibacterium virtanenii]|uniref:HTH-type transcriptional regulator DegA n=1 Tax=Acidipropionibacterium virtanenii TaxID=2057246 RepID=A0A344UYB5_9ACTN|nr:LacI family DNA-binding transcriptional regulator [Acidipropionibacterium virtanenii]AXE40263.1 HTH-type transcriptional regulator DegA [Acidipropionibacterium virtanenii]